MNVSFEDVFIYTKQWDNFISISDGIVSIPREEFLWINTFLDQIIMPHHCSSIIDYNKLKIDIAPQLDSIEKWLYNTISQCKNLVKNRLGFCIITWIPAIREKSNKIRIFYFICSIFLWTLDYEKWPFYEVYDRGVRWNTIRYSDTNLSHGFHTDGIKIDSYPKYVWLLCLHQSDIGWESQLVNIVNIYKLLSKSTRNVLKWSFYRYKIAKDTFYPIFSWENKKLYFRYMRKRIDVAYQNSISILSKKQINALNLLDETINNSNILEFRLQNNDILFFDNTILAHNRKSFYDKWNSHKRLLLRAWIYE